MRTIAIIQARIGSTRFPGKVLSEVKGKPLIVHMIDRLKRCRFIDRIVLATSDLARDRVLLDLAAREGIAGFAGNEHDVLDRYYQIAYRLKPEIVVRCTGDCPLIDPQVTDLVIQRHIEKRKDYTSNTVIRSYPRGLDTEAMTFLALEKAAKEAHQPYQREHVTPYIFEHPELFSIEQVLAEPSRHQPGLRLTVDTKEDLLFSSEIFNRLYERNPFFLIDDVLNLLNDCPELKKINSHIRQKATV